MKYLKTYKIFEFVDNEFNDLFISLKDKGYSINSNFGNSYKMRLNKDLNPQNTYVCGIQKVYNGYVEFKIEDIYEDIEFTIKYLKSYGIHLRSVRLVPKELDNFDIDGYDLPKYMNTNIIRIIFNFVEK